MSLALTSSDQHQFSALLVALTYAEGVGAKTARRIVEYCHQNRITAEDWWASKDICSLEIAMSKKVVESIQSIKKEHSLYEYLEHAIARGLAVLPFFADSYPPLLREIDDYPALLFVESHLPLAQIAWPALLAQSISVVGTRKMTAYGQLVLRELLPPLIELGYSIVSGFMYGVDLEAARVVVAKSGRTVAVLGYGHEHCFPNSQHRDRELLLDAGAVFLSEYPPQFPPLPSNFVARNRIVAGLTQATLVVEAATKSGSHITAAYANEYGRLVMAVPGPITNPFSLGTKALIDQGATLVANSQDIVQALRDDYGLQQLTRQTHSAMHGFSDELQSLSPQLRAVCERLQAAGSMSFTQLQACCHFDERTLNQLLFDLELQGRISKQRGTYCLNL